jgi:protein Mpv17
MLVPTLQQEGKGLQGGIERWKAAFLPTYASGSVFWPIANMINFSFVPATQRVPYINVCGECVPYHQGRGMLGSTSASLDKAGTHASTTTSLS